MSDNMADILTLQTMVKEGKYTPDEQEIIISAMKGVISEQEMWAQLAVKGAVTLKGVL